MKFLYVILFIAFFAFVRLRRRRLSQAKRQHRPIDMAFLRSGVALVTWREVRERVRGKIFRYGTLLILTAIAAAIVIPTLHHSKTFTQRIGVVGSLSPALKSVVHDDVRAYGGVAQLVSLSSDATAKSEVRSGRLHFAILEGRSIVVKSLRTSNDASEIVQIAHDLGVAQALGAAHLSAAQSAAFAQAHALHVTSLVPQRAKSANIGASVFGLIFIFMMLQQYNTWTLLGVMEEKSSRVIEVLLSTLRPIQLLAGKVLGIGLVALAQATLIVSFALVLAKAVGSNLLHGAAPLEIVSVLVWLILGYAFYSWIYAAAGSMAERQDQVQTLALPLSVPLIIGYVASLIGASGTHASTLLTVLAYLPPTAPFAMPVLVGFGAVSGWGFMASVLLSLAATYAIAHLAASVYRRAILQTGARVHLRDAISRS